MTLLQRALLRAIRYVDYVAGGDATRDDPAKVVDDGLEALLTSGASVDEICDDTQFDRKVIESMDARRNGAPTTRYYWVCSRCGGHNVNCSGLLQWDFLSQEWVFDGAPLDDDFCQECERETKMVQKFA